MTGAVTQLARPVLLWAVHFISVYALISAACAPRGLLDLDVMRSVAALLTLAAGALVLIWLLQGWRTLGREGTENTTLSVAAVWCAGISLLAIVGNLWPVAFLAECGG